MKLDDIGHAGDTVDDRLYNFLTEADCAECRTEDGESLFEAVDTYERMLARPPTRIADALGKNEHDVRLAIYALICDVPWDGDWQREEVIKQIAATVKRKEDVVRVMAHYASCVNEFFRLMWLCAEHGGWRKEANA